MSARVSDRNRARRAGYDAGLRHPYGLPPPLPLPFSANEMQRAWLKGWARGRVAQERWLDAFWRGTALAATRVFEDFMSPLFRFAPQLAAGWKR